MCFVDRKIIYFIFSIFLLFFIPYPKMRYGYLVEAISDSLHFPIFSFLTFGAFYLFKRIKSNIILLLILLLPSLIEIIQPIFGRGASFDDLINGYLGIFSTLFFIFRGSKKLIILSLSSMLLGVMLISNAISKEVKIVKTQLNNFPIIFSSNFPDPVDFWLTVNSSLDQNLFVETKRNVFSGIEYKANGFDWSKYKKLKIQINLVNITEMPINLRVDDKQKCKEYEDRYNGQFMLLAPENIIEISLQEIANGPKFRKLDLSFIQRFIIFTNPQSFTAKFIIKQVSLE